MKKAAFLHSVVVTPLICGAALLVASAPAAAGMQWKWKDASGAIQYSDRPPPPGVSEKDILSRPLSAKVAPKPAATESAPTSSVPASAPSVKTVDPELEAKRKKAEEEKKAQQKAEEEKAAKSRAEVCQRARSYQRTLNDGIRISRTNANGEREILDDKGRADELKQAEDSIKANCK